MEAQHALFLQSTLETALREAKNNRIPPRTFLNRPQKKDTEQTGTPIVQNSAFELYFMKNKFSSQYSTITHYIAWRSFQVKGAFSVRLAKINMRNNLWYLFTFMTLDLHLCLQVQRQLITEARCQGGLSRISPYMAVASTLTLVY